MAERPDYPALIAGYMMVLDRVNAGEAGLPDLDRLVRIAGETVGALGAIFIEYRQTAGRIIAATGAAEWALGRPVPTDDPATAATVTGPRVREVRVDTLAGDLARQLAGRGLRRMLVARAETRGLVIGSLHALYPDPEAVAGPDQHAVLGYTASCTAHLYSEQAGLPMHWDGPVLAALADGLVIVDRDCRIRLWNPAAEQISGESAEQMLNRPLPFPLPPPGQVLDHQMPGGRWLRITSGEIPGSVACRVVSFRDITDEQRRDHDRDLFAAVTGHDLRTPVTVIKGYADMLSDHWDSVSEPDRRQAAGVIGQRAGELARLVDRLLSVASDAGSVGGTPPEPFDLADTLRATVPNLPAGLRHRLTVALPEYLPKALGDRASIATVLTELATNAIKYSAAGTRVELTADADERSVALRVADRGIGIRPEHVERAFERFWQEESGDRRRYPGSGLGLYLVRRIVERQNGWVSLRPRDGGGTVAEVRLPRV
jgi:nitrogen-specific signal transduction histidine kinase